MKLWDIVTGQCLYTFVSALALIIYSGLSWFNGLIICFQIDADWTWQLGAWGGVPSFRQVPDLCGRWQEHACVGSEDRPVPQDLRGAHTLRDLHRLQSALSCGSHWLCGPGRQSLGVSLTFQSACHFFLGFYFCFIFDLFHPFCHIRFSFALRLSFFQQESQKTISCFTAIFSYPV